MGTALCLKVSESLQREDMDELVAIYKEFERSADQSFVLDFTALRSASEKACYLLASIVVSARKKGRVYVLTPKNHILEQLLEMQVIKTSEIYENRNLIAQAMKDIVKGNIPEV
jgi:anti-anti-sigma regulatory factor